MARWNDNHSLDEFGVETETTPPKIQYDERITVPGTSNIAGHVGPMPTRDVLGFIKLCDKTDRMYDPRAHALDDRVLSKIRSYGVQRVIAYELDSKVVWEWTIRDWSDDQSVPKRIRGDQPPQTYALLDDAEQWPDVGDDIRVSDDAELAHGHKTSHDWNTGDDE